MRCALIATCGCIAWAVSGLMRLNWLSGSKGARESKQYKVCQPMILTTLSLKANSIIRLNWMERQLFSPRQTVSWRLNLGSLGLGIGTDLTPLCEEHGAHSMSSRRMIVALV